MPKRKQKLQLVPQDLLDDPEKTARAAARELRRITRIKKFHVCVVFGTGWDPAIRQLGRKLFEIKATRLPGFLPPTAEGHAGRICGYRIKGKYVLVFRGRKHLYEFRYGTGMEAILHYVRVARAAGCTTFVHTNAVGGTHRGLKVGQAVLVRDFNKLITGMVPALRGAHFLECSAMFSRRLRRICRTIDPTLFEGVIAQVHGPDFETPSEAAYLRRNGIAVVSMSMIPESIVSRMLRMAFLGLSIVTDPAGEKVTHKEVQRVVRKRAAELGRFLRSVVERL